MSNPNDPFYYFNQQLSEALNAIQRPYVDLIDNLEQSPISAALDQFTQEPNPLADAGISNTVLALTKESHDSETLLNAINPGFNSILNGETPSYFSETDNILKAFHQQAEENQQKIQDFFNPQISSLDALSNSYDNLLDNILNPLNLDFLDKLERPDKIVFQNIIDWLLSRGWSLDWGNSFFKIFQSQSKEKQKSNDIFNFFKSNAKPIIKKANKLSPHRKKIIKTAYKAHKRGEYELSVPVFLSQTEGIAIDHFGVDGLFYKNPENKKEIESLFKSCDDSKLSTQLISKFKSPIFQNKNQRAEGFTGLNRHMVLHGESTDYATEENSLKCLSLMNYICQMIEKNRNI